MTTQKPICVCNIIYICASGAYFEFKKVMCLPRVSSIFKKSVLKLLDHTVYSNTGTANSCALLQLSQVQLAVAASLPGPDRDSLISLQSNIEELITLTRENLTGLQNQEDRDLLQTGAADQYDKEYALLKVSWKYKIMRCDIKPNKWT
jgi:hypothetical protein